MMEEIELRWHQVAHRVAQAGAVLDALLEARRDLNKRIHEAKRKEAAALADHTDFILAHGTALEAARQRREQRDAGQGDLLAAEGVQDGR